MTWIIQKLKGFKMRCREIDLYHIQTHARIITNDSHSMVEIGHSHCAQPPVRSPFTTRQPMTSLSCSRFRLLNYAYLGPSQWSHLYVPFSMVPSDICLLSFGLGKRLFIHKVNRAITRYNVIHKIHANWMIIKETNHR